MAQRSCTIQLTPPATPPSPPVTTIPFTITGSTVAGMGTQTIDAIDPTAAFQANDGDGVTLIGTQTNSVGTSTTSAPLFFVVAAGVVTPSTPVVGTVPPPPVVASITAT